MNDLSLPSPVARARDLARLIAAEADAIEHGRRLTEPVVEELHQARLFRMLYPRSVQWATHAARGLTSGSSREPSASAVVSSW